MKQEQPRFGGLSGGDISETLRCELSSFTLLPWSWGRKIAHKNKEDWKTRRISQGSRLVCRAKPVDCSIFDFETPRDHRGDMSSRRVIVVSWVNFPAFRKQRRGGAFLPAGGSGKAVPGWCRSNSDIVGSSSPLGLIPPFVGSWRGHKSRVDFPPLPAPQGAAGAWMEVWIPSNLNQFKWHPMGFKFAESMPQERLEWPPKQTKTN